MARVMLIWPGVTLGGWNSLHTKSTNEATFCSHGYMSMSAVLKQRGHSSFLLDMRDTLGWGHFEQCVARTEFDIAAIGFISADHDTALKACSIVKHLHPTKPLLAGGIHLSALALESFPYVDTIVWGEGDYVLADLVSQYQEGQPLPPLVQAPVVTDLDALPFVDRDLFDGEPERQHPIFPSPLPNITILTSRGCAFRCAYCNPSGKAVFGPHLRERSVGNVIEELRGLQARYGIGSIMYHSDILGSEKWIEQFAEAFGRTFGYIPFFCQLRADFIVKHPDLVKALSDVGMYWVSLGLESGSDRMLQFMHKGTTVAMNLEAAEILHQNQVNIFANLIIGSPTETESEMRQTLEMAKKIRPAWWSANPFASFPGSDFYQYCVDHDLLTNEMYSKTVYPYQRKIKGLDYGLVFGIRDEILTHKRPIVPPKKKLQTVGRGMQPSPKLSVIMRTYNRPDLLERAATSILAQTFQDYELIIVDDGSTEPGVAPLLDQLEAQDVRVRVLRNAMNRDGHCILLNEGIDAARGQYIGFCDDDDMRDPQWAAEMTSQLDHHPEWMYAVCQSRNINMQSGTSVVARGVMPTNVEELYSHNWIDLGELMVRRETFDLVGMFDERIHYGDDWEFISRLVRAKVPGGAYKVPLCVHYIHTGGQLNTRKKEQREFTRSIIEKRTVPMPYKVSVLWPDMDRMESSHKTVVVGVRDAVLRIPNVVLYGEGNLRHGRVNGADLVMVICSFLCRGTEMEDLRKKTPAPILAFHTEDPPALSVSQRHAQFVDFVSTNDASCEGAYDGKPTFICPSLSVNTAVVGAPRPRLTPPSWDMCIVGYAYDSRLTWMRTVMDRIDWKLLLVGRRWEEFSDRFTVLGDQGLNETMDIYADSKIVCCVQRQSGELGMASPPFLTPARGYVETYSGACVMIDDSRPLFPPYNKEEILPFRYGDPEDFVEKTHWALSHDVEREKMGKVGQDRAIRDFTYVARIRQLLLCVRSPRLNRRIA